MPIMPDLKVGLLGMLLQHQAAQSWGIRVCSHNVDRVCPFGVFAGVLSTGASARLLLGLGLMATSAVTNVVILEA
jgi:hypothetical protein